MGTRKILIASDDPRRATELAARIVALGYASPSVAYTADGMLATASTLRPDLVIADVALDPERDAHQLATALSRVHPSSIVFTTDDASDAALRRANLGDGDCVLAAPYSGRELRVTLELALCRHDQAQNAVDLENRFFAVSIDMLCQLDFNGYFKRLNPAWERTLGFTLEELRSRPFIEFVHPDDRDRTLAQNREVRGGGHALGFENRYLCKDGSYRWFLWNAASDPGERVIYSVARDITARKAAEEERERLLGELQTALAEVKVLQEILPICSYCKKIRDDENFWLSVESYISRHTNTKFSHGICPDCMTLHVEPQIAQLEP